MRYTRPRPVTGASACCGSIAPSTGLTAAAKASWEPANTPSWTRCQPRTSARRRRRAPSAPSLPPRASGIAREERASNTEPLSLGIEEHRRDDACTHLLVLQWKGADDLRTLVSQATAVETEGYGLAQLGRPGHGGDVAATVSAQRLAGGEQDRAAPQLPARLQTLYADQAPALGRLQHRPLTQLASHVGFLARGHAPESEIIQSVAMIELESRHVTLLDAQRSECLETIRPDVQRRGGVQHVLPQRLGTVGRCIELVG